MQDHPSLRAVQKLEPVKVNRFPASAPSKVNATDKNVKVMEIRGTGKAADIVFDKRSSARAVENPKKQHKQALVPQPREKVQKEKPVVQN
eukprot:6491041-Amphidinium_carterae.3